MKVLQKINQILAQFTIFFIKIYQLLLSPDKWIPSLWLKGKICKHTPHCSQYWINVLKRYWFIPWIFMTMERISQCTPWTEKTYDPDHYKVVFFSSAPIWVDFLTTLKQDKKFEIVWVVTSPDKPVGRWLKIQENIIKKTAKKIFEKKENIEDIIKTPKRINPDKSKSGKEFTKWLEEKNPDFFVVIAYGKIIPQKILDIPHFAPINVHGSILPKYRWASPIQSIFLNNEKETWITIMKMDAMMDTGDIIKTLKFPITLENNTLDIINKMINLWPNFLNKTIWEFGKWLIQSHKQDNTKATYCSKIEKEDGLIDIQKDSLENIYNKHRAFFLWPKIWFTHKDKRFIIEKIIINNENYEDRKNQALILDNNINPAIQEIKIKPEGKKAITGKDFLQWYFKN